jgi:hypothetical protein
MSEYTFAVGDRVQYTDEDDDVFVGEIKSLFSREEDGETVQFAKVLWDEGEDTEPESDETEDWELELLVPEGEEDELESEFQKLCDEHMEEIDAQLQIASDAIAKAEELSEKYGLPFSSSVTPLSQSYTPTSYYEKFRGLSTGFVSDLTGAYPGGEYDNEGWEHSAVC